MRVVGAATSALIASRLSLARSTAYGPEVGGGLIAAGIEGNGAGWY